jgi:RND superfamily putative drug exporter
MAEGFGPGFNGPLTITGKITGMDQMGDLMVLAAAVGADPGVQTVSPPLPNAELDPSAFLIRVVPTTSPQDQATVELVERLRSEVIPTALADSPLEVFVAGSVAISIDFTNYLSDRLVIFIGVVLAVSFVLLMMVFRSILVPIKAVLMNIISIASAYGVVVAIFQWGWLKSVFGVEPAPIEPFVPMMMFAIVFGLSMDYEVFLLSRIREEWDRTRDAVSSVADGLAATARVITAAAAIMIVVFGSFLLDDNRILKLFGVGLAVAVFLDATLVRMLLVPATMALLGDRNWWLPAWLDRILPRLNVEGPTHATTPSEDSELVSR